MIVLDASATVHLLLSSDTGRFIRLRLIDRGDTLHAPQLLDIEVSATLRKMALQSRISPQQSEAAFAALLGLAVQRYGHAPLLPRVWQLRANLTPYDASYVALAEALGAPLVTTDARLARAPGHTATIELL